MDAEVKKQVLRRVTYGLYVLTAATKDDFAAGAVNWLSQASFNPPLVMAGVRSDGHLRILIDRTGGFGVNVLAATQQDIAAAFFRPTQVEGNRLNGYVFESGPEIGAPLLVELPSWFEARVTDAVRRGDHTVYVAEVVSAGLRDPHAKALVMWDTKWSYGG